MTFALQSLTAIFLFAVSTLPGLAQDTDFGPLKGKVFGAGERATVVFLHGDVSGGGPANYHYALAEILTAFEPDITAVALLRPGYEDGQGRQSPGTNHKRRDQYTRANNDLVAQTLQSLRDAHPDRTLIVMGHSGGAAQLGVVIARFPGILDTAILVSCPCNIARWRRAQNARPYKRSQSPQYYVDRVPAETNVVAITGSSDENTFPALAQDYIDALNANGGNGTFQLIDGGTHWDATMSTSMLKTIRQILENSAK